MIGENIKRHRILKGLSLRKYEQLVLRLYSQNLITQSRFNELMEGCEING